MHKRDNKKDIIYHIFCLKLYQTKVHVFITTEKDQR